jgi:hypothetical protein
VYGCAYIVGWEHAFTKKREGCVKIFLKNVVAKFCHLVWLRCRRIATRHGSTGSLRKCRLANVECRIGDIHVIRGRSYIRVYSWLTKLERVVLSSPALPPKFCAFDDSSAIVFRRSRSTLVPSLTSFPSV